MGQIHRIDIEPVWENMAGYFYQLANQKNISEREFRLRLQPILNGYGLLRKFMKEEITEQQFIGTINESKR